MIQRRYHIQEVRRLLRDNPVVGLVGPRQVGKATLAAQVAAADRVEAVPLGDAAPILAR